MASQNSQQCSLADLPTGTLVHVSSYLHPLSRALFAAALDYHDRDGRLNIIGDHYKNHMLDFGKIEKELASKLSDDDIRGVLLAINAIHGVRVLLLTNCINISGSGLEPLRGSTIIEQIDLSLVGELESPELDPDPPISCAEILPILYSIIEMQEEMEKSSLRHLIFPQKWRKERNTESDFHAFLDRYNELLCNQEESCFECNHDLILYEDTMIEMSTAEAKSEQYGTQYFTCYGCLEHYCPDCVEVDDEGDEIRCMSSLCSNCNRRYCFDCSRQRQCYRCDDSYCEDCTNQCSCCGRNVCPDCTVWRTCRNNCGVGNIWCGSVDDDFLMNTLLRCESCRVDYCVNCCKTDDRSVRFCDSYRRFLCGECRVMNKCSCIGC